MRLSALLAAEQLGLTVLTGADQLDRDGARGAPGRARDQRHLPLERPPHADSPSHSSRRVHGAQAGADAAYRSVPPRMDPC